MELGIHRVKKITIGPVELYKNTRWRTITIVHDDDYLAKDLKMEITVFPADDDVEIVVEK